MSSSQPPPTPSLPTTSPSDPTKAAEFYFRGPAGKVPLSVVLTKEESENLSRAAVFSSAVGATTAAAFIIAPISLSYSGKFPRALNWVFGSKILTHSTHILVGTAMGLGVTMYQLSKEIVKTESLRPYVQATNAARSAKLSADKAKE
jgi:hypothetical protein